MWNHDTGLQRVYAAVTSRKRFNKYSVHHIGGVTQFSQNRMQTTSYTSSYRIPLWSYMCCTGKSQLFYMHAVLYFRQTTSVLLSQTCLHLRESLLSMGHHTITLVLWSSTGDLDRQNMQLSNKQRRYTVEWHQYLPRNRYNQLAVRCSLLDHDCLKRHQSVHALSIRKGWHWIQNFLKYTPMHVVKKLFLL